MWFTHGKIKKKLDVEKLKREAGLALQDIISEIYYYILAIEFPPDTRIFLLENLAEIE